MVNCGTAAQNVIIWAAKNGLSAGRYSRMAWVFDMKCGTSQKQGRVEKSNGYVVFLM